MSSPGQETGTSGFWPPDEAARQVRLAMASGVLLLLGLVAFSVDIPLKLLLDPAPPKAAPTEGDSASPAKSWGIPGDVRRFFNLCEVFAHGLGVAIIGLGVWMLDPQGRKNVPRILLCAYLGGLIAVSIKLFVARTRPEYFHGDDVASTFTGWFPWFSSPTKEQSLASGHAATAAAFAAALAWQYPHGCCYFALLAVLAWVQRLTADAHYLSDVLIGGGLGLAFAAIWLPAGGLSRLLRPIEWYWEATPSEASSKSEPQDKGDASTQ